MKRMQKAKYFLSGILCTLMLIALTEPALGAMIGKAIQVYTGVNIYVDDTKLNPKDANGNPVEAFIYNGTTYLPVRAVGEAVGKTVQWEGKTSSVYIGKHTSDKPAVWLDSLDYFDQKFDWFAVTVNGTGKDNCGNTYEREIACRYFDRTYNLNGMYSSMTGTFYQRYDYRDVKTNGTMTVYADGDVVYRAEMTSGVSPIDFNIDLTGVMQMRIEVSHSSMNAGERRIALGNCGLWT